MKDTTSNRQLLNRLKGLCDGTPYEMNIWQDEGFIGPHLYTRDDAPKYTPDFYLEDDVFIDNTFRVEVQTTSYGALAPESIAQVAQGLMTAAQLAKAMSVQIQLAGYRVLHG